MSKCAIALLNSDPVMSALIEKIGPIRLRPRRLSPFQSLAHAIIHQQLNSNAAGSILERFKGLFPDDGFPTPGQVAKTSVDRLRTAGLSRPKAAYIIDLAKHCNAGLIPSVNDCDTRPPPVAATARAIPPVRPATVPENPKVSWDRITIRLTAGELEKINDVVIATQQANRWGRVTTTDILRVALRRVKDQEAIDVREIKALRAHDGRFARGGKV